MLKFFRYLAIPMIAVAIGCSAPQNKFSSAEILRDSRNFSNANVYGKCETDLGNVFGQFEMKSYAKTHDLTNFNTRIRLVRPMYHGLGEAVEYRDFSGDSNGVSGVGISYDTGIIGLQIRAYPLRTDQTQEAGLSFGNIFEYGDLDPYVRGFVDVNRKNGKYFSTGKFQIGLKTNQGWRVGLEFRYSDFDRKNRTGNPGIAFGAGLDF
jgi:hypothetical protein